MAKDTVIQVLCEEEFKRRVEAAASKDARSASSYAYVALQEKLEKDEK